MSGEKAVSDKHHVVVLEECFEGRSKNKFMTTVVASVFFPARNWSTKTTNLLSGKSLADHTSILVDPNLGCGRHGSSTSRSDDCGGDLGGNGFGVHGCCWMNRSCTKWADVWGVCQADRRWRWMYEAAAVDSRRQCSVLLLYCMLPES